MNFWNRYFCSIQSMEVIMTKTVFLIVSLISFCSPCFASVLISEKHQVVPVTISISMGSLGCEDGTDDYGNPETNLWLDWDYHPYTLLKLTDRTPAMRYYATHKHCPDLATIEREASAHKGVIFRDLSTTMREYIGTQWGDCKRFREEWTEVQLLPGITIIGWQFKILESLPSERCVL